MNSPNADERLQRGAKQDLRSVTNGAKAFAMTRKEEAIPTNTFLSFNFSACLLIKDDNQILPEWIAYHYTVLPLRHLIVAVDPFSLTSPEPILDKFRELGMDIELWRDEDYLYRDRIFWRRIKALAQISNANEKKVKVHRIRQSCFYERCLKQFKRQNHSWAILIDTDEYLTYNNYDENEGQPRWYDKQASLSESERYALTEKFNHLIENNDHPRLQLPHIGQTTISQYIETQVKANSSHWKELPCILLPRVQFVAMETKPDEIAANVPDGFHPISFHTLRYRFHGPKQQNAKPGKSLVNLIGFDNRKIFNPHKIMVKKCTGETPYPDYSDSLLRVHHYTGSQQLYLSRPGDSRRSVQEFLLRNENVTGYDNSLQSWLGAFVSRVGKEKALVVTERLRDWALIEDARSTSIWNSQKNNFPYPFFERLTPELQAEFASSSLLKELDPTLAEKE